MRRTAKRAVAHGRWKGWTADVMLGLIGLGMLVPFFWMAVVSLQADDQAAAPFGRALFHSDWSNYRLVWERLPMLRYFGNSLFVVAASVTLGTAMTIGAAYAFSTFSFYGKKTLLAILLGTLMIPEHLLLIANYTTVARFGWIDRYSALVIPLTTNGFAVFYLIQSFASIPREYRFAARADGAGSFNALRHVIAPLAKQPIMTLVLLKAINQWNAYLWPLLATNSAEMRVLPVGLLVFRSEAGTAYGPLMAASVCVVVPIVALYFILQRHILRAIPERGSLKI